MVISPLPSFSLPLLYVTIFKRNFWHQQAVWKVGRRKDRDFLSHLPGTIYQVLREDWVALLMIWANSALSLSSSEDNRFSKVDRLSHSWQNPRVHISGQHSLNLHSGEMKENNGVFFVAFAREGAKNPILPREKTVSLETCKRLLLILKNIPRRILKHAKHVVHATHSDIWSHLKKRKSHCLGIRPYK